MRLRLALVAYTGVPAFAVPYLTKAGLYDLSVFVTAMDPNSHVAACIMPPVDLLLRRRYMPKFDTVPIEDARGKSAFSGKRAQILQEYQGYIDQLKSGQAGRLVAGAGETTATVRRRIGAAARAAGHKLTIRRAGDEVYFWATERRRSANGRRRRGRGASS